MDILIHAGGREQRYVLHRLILAQCSGFFEVGTSEEWSRQPGQSQAMARMGENGTAGPEPGPVVGSGERKPRWRYELDHGSGSDDIPMLVQKVG